MSLDARDILRMVRRRPVKFVPSRRVVSIYPGEWPSPFEGKGFEPLRFRDFEMGDDPRRIHPPSSARRGTPTVGERVALRDFRIMVTVDCSASMAVREKAEIQFIAAALLLYSAWQAETTFELALQNGDKLTSFGAGIGSRHFYYLYHTLQRLLFDAEVAPRGTSVALSRATPPNTMILYCSDFLEPDGELVDLSGFWKKVRRYDLIPVVIQDDFEASFPPVPGETFIPFANPETGEAEEIWLSRRGIAQLRAANELRFQTLKAEFDRHGARLVHLSTADMQQAEKRFNAFFRQRPRR